MENTPTLTTSEEQRAPWNDNSQNYVTKDVTIYVTYSKTIPMLFPRNTEVDDEYVEDELRKYDMLPLKNGRHNAWEEDELAIIVE